MTGTQFFWLLVLSLLAGVVLAIAGIEQLPQVLIGAVIGAVGRDKLTKGGQQ